MAPIDRYDPARAIDRPDRGHHLAGYSCCTGHCPTRCACCRPDTDARALGELVMAAVAVAVAVLGIGVRHPRAAALIVAASVVAHLVA